VAATAQTTNNDKSCPVDVADALADEATSLPVQLLRLLLLGSWHLHQAPYAAVTSCVRNERTQQRVSIDTVGFHPTSPAIDLQAGRFDDNVLDAGRPKVPMQPEAVISGLIARSNLDLRAGPLFFPCACPFNRSG
jgi:hypothetical protein